MGTNIFKDTWDGWYNFGKDVGKDVGKKIEEIKKFVPRFFINGCAEISAALGLDVSGMLLVHSLQDHPYNLYYGNASDIAKKLKESRILQGALEEKFSLSTNGYVNDKVEVTFGYKNSPDLALGVHRVTIYASGNLIDGRGHLDLTFTDKYDFQHSKHIGIIDCINNIANFLEERGVIRNYFVTVQFDYCLRCN